MDGRPCDRLKRNALNCVPQVASKLRGRRRRRHRFRRRSALARPARFSRTVRPPIAQRPDTWWRFRGGHRGWGVIGGDPHSKKVAFFGSFRPRNTPERGFRLVGADWIQKKVCLKRSENKCCECFVLTYFLKFTR